MNLLEEEITEKIIKTFYNVYNELGHGFLEVLYKKALKKEFESLGLKIECEKPVTVHYKGDPLGLFYMDMVVHDSVVIEVKTADILHVSHELQLKNYLRATDLEVGLLLSFGKNPIFKRMIYTNDKKRVTKISGMETLNQTHERLP